jgi:sensor histidine kinase regulating citrate/malate metabolism
MRTASLLKHAAHLVLFFGIATALGRLPLGSMSFWWTILALVVIWLVLRLLAIMGQLLYEMRNDSTRVLIQVERSLYQLNASAQEIRDLIDAKADQDAA